MSDDNDGPPDGWWIRPALFAALFAVVMLGGWGYEKWDMYQFEKSYHPNAGVPRLSDIEDKTADVVDYPNEPGTDVHFHCERDAVTLGGLSIGGAAQSCSWRHRNGQLAPQPARIGVLGPPIITNQA